MDDLPGRLIGGAGMFLILFGAYVGQSSEDGFPDKFLAAIAGAFVGVLATGLFWLFLIAAYLTLGLEF